jgi:phosphomethylpyrimidine synthase
MKTQIELAREGNITEQMTTVALDEGIPREIIRQRVADGQIVIPVHQARPCQKVIGIGKGLRTKVNASIGTSSDIVDIDLEVRKAKIAELEKLIPLWNSPPVAI